MRFTLQEIPTPPEVWDATISLDEKVFSSEAEEYLTCWRLNENQFDECNIQKVHRSGRITCGILRWLRAAYPGELVELMQAHEFMEIL